MTGDDTRGQTPGRHWVNGQWIACCETGETTCPCTCHDQDDEPDGDGQ